MTNNGNDNNIESALTLIPDYIEFLPRRSTRNCIEQLLYPNQIAYSSGLLPKASIKAPEAGLYNSFTNFVSSHTVKSHEYIVWIFCMLSSNIDNEGIDKPASLKRAMAWYDWPE